MFYVIIKFTEIVYRRIEARKPKLYKGNAFLGLAHTEQKRIWKRKRFCDATAFDGKR